MSRSWIDEISTERKYKLFSNPSLVWLVKNEFQLVKCPDCNGAQFCRLTRIWQLDAQNHNIVLGSQIHLNYNKNLDDLKHLLVEYALENDQDSGIIEEKFENIWMLTCKGEKIGEEIK